MAPMITFESFGGAGVVTGSCHLLQIDNTRILIDCGMFQGDEEGLNHEGFAFDPADIDYLLVTHAHLDHIGRIPMLVKEGFDGRIVSTPATFALAKLMLHNAGGIIEENPKPIYTSHDVGPALAKFDTFLEYDGSLRIGEDIVVTFKNAGHILGSAIIKIDYKDGDEDKSVVFSGDLGQDSRIITSQLQGFESAHYLFVESTYADRLHKNMNVSIMEFKTYIADAIKHGATVVIPSFALERTQEVLYILRQMSLKGDLDGAHVFLDAPLAINVTKTFLNYPKLFNNEVRRQLEDNINPFDFKQLVHTQSREASQKIEVAKGAKVIIAGSGMCEGGRVQKHLKRYLSDESAVIIFVGFQVESTLGHEILHKDRVEIEGITLEKNALIREVDGFSAHADRDDLLEWIEAVEGLKKIFLIHGDAKKLKTFTKLINKRTGIQARAVAMHDPIDL